MQKMFLFFLFLVFALTFASAEIFTLGEGDGYVIEVLSSNEQSTIIEIKLNSFEIDNVEINGETYSQISLDKTTYLKEKGYPDLPKVRKSIIIPENKQMNFRILEEEFTSLTVNNVKPSKGFISRKFNPKDIEYTFSDFYNSDEIFPATSFSIDAPYILREVRGLVFTFNPFQFQANSNILKVTRSIKVEIYQTGLTDSNILENAYSKFTKDFRDIYQHHFINYDEYFNNRYDYVSEKGRMLIIYADMYESTILPLYEWKLQKGMQTFMEPISSIGNDYIDIKARIAEYYEEELSLAYVLLVGEADQVEPHPAGYSAGDPLYSLMTSDDYPDLFISRFCGSELAEIEVQVAKTLNYEREPQLDAGWYSKGVGIGSNQGGGGSGDEGQSDIAHLNEIRDWLLDFTFSEVDQIYDPGASGSDVFSSLNDGRSLVNYTGHGSATSWATTSFDNNDVDNLDNAFKLPFITSVACNNGEFDNYECFAEHWLKAGTPDSPKGAVGFYGSSISQAWDPPMEGQDEFNLLLTGNSSTGPYTHTFGALCFNGSSSMLDQYGDAGNIFPTWIIFGDGSVMLRTAAPEEIDPVHLPIFPIGATEYEVFVDGVSEALISIYKDGVLYGSSYTDEEGNGLIEFGEPVIEAGVYQLTITGFNLATYIANLEGASLCNVEFSLSSIPINSLTTLEIEITSDELLPMENVLCWADGIGDEYDTEAVPTNSEGIAVLNVNYPFGSSIMLYGKRAEDNYNLFEEVMPITGGNDFTTPDFTIANNFNLNDGFVAGIDGTINIDVSEDDCTIWAFANEEEPVTNQGNSLIFAPAEVGVVKTVLTKANYNIYSETFPVITSTGSISGTITEAETGNPASNLEIRFYARDADITSDTELFSAITDENGEYEIEEEYPVAYYDVYIESFNYNIYYEEDFILGIGNDNVKDIELTLSVPSTINGTITNSSGGNLIATIKAFRNDTGELYNLVTSESDGSYELDLHDFTYTIKVKAQGYLLHSEMLILNGDEQIDFELLSSSGVLIINGDLTGENAGASVVSGVLTGIDVANTVVDYTETAVGDWDLYEGIIYITGSKEPSEVGILEFQSSLVSFMENERSVWVEGGRVGYFYSDLEEEFLNSILHEIRGGGVFSDLNIQLSGHSIATIPHQLPEVLEYSGTGVEDGTRITVTEDCDLVADWVSAPNRSSINCANESTVFTSFVIDKLSDEVVRSNLVENICSYLGFYILPNSIEHSSSFTKIQNQTRLFSNRPNPFNPLTTISYELGKSSAVKLEIYNIKGQQIRTLIDFEQSAGNHSVLWDGRNENGVSVSSGLYFYRLETDTFSQTEKMLLLK